MEYIFIHLAVEALVPLPPRIHCVTKRPALPTPPIVMTARSPRSEDGTVRIWHSTTYRLESTLNYGLERVWALGYIKGSNSCVWS